LRGGSWDGNQDDARAGSRSGDHPDDRSGNAGFRVLCASPIR
jgi:formylglycine-generating enzyme required for sulfatase activity